MPNGFQISLLLALFCFGCDSAARQQQAEHARRAATAAELKRLGQSMHDQQNKQSSPDGASVDIVSPAEEAKEEPSIPTSTDDSSSAAEGTGNSAAEK